VKHSTILIVKIFPSDCIRNIIEISVHIMQYGDTIFVLNVFFFTQEINRALKKKHLEVIELTQVRI